MLTRYETQILRQRRTDIQILRALAVILVVIFHFNKSWMEYGFLGVDLFFHISGFVVTLSILNSVSNIKNGGKFDFWAFFLRRFKRLFLPLAVTCIITLIISFLFLSPETLNLSSYSALFSIAAVSNVFFLLESGYFSAPAESFLLLHTWSLSIEEQFYLIVGLVFGINYIRISKSIIIILSAISLLLYIQHSFLGANYFSDDQVFYLIFFRFWQLGLGCIAAFVLIEIDKRKINIAAGWYYLSLAFLAAVIIIIALNAVSIHLSTLLIAISCFCLFTTGYTRDIRRSNVFNVLSKIGDRSYSLYLIHWPLIGLFVYFGGGAIKNYLICFILILALTELLYRFVEKGISFKSDKFWAVMSMYSVMLITAFCAFSTYSDGMTWRVKDLDSKKLEIAELTTTRAWKKKLTAVSKTTVITTYTPPNKKFKTRILVLGDSHAGTLRNLGRELVSDSPIEWTVMSFPGCPPIFGYHKHYNVKTQRGGNRELECEAQIIQWEKDIVKHGKTFDYVILASRWNWLFNDNSFMGKDIRDDRLAPANFRDPVSQEQSRKNFENGLDYTVNVISKSGSKAIVATQGPLAIMQIKDCDTIPFQKYFHKLVNCDAYSYPDITARGAFVDHVAKTLYNENRIGLLPLVELLCDDLQKSCESHQDGHRISDDDDHLNAWGGKVLAARWRESEYWLFNDFQQ